MICRRALLLLILTALCLSCISQAHASINCDLCGKAISGPYYKLSDGRIICQDCRESIAVCDQCGQLTTSVINVDGRNYCSSCYAKLERCGLCGKPISGNFMYYPALNLKVCDKCEREKPKCERCGVPTNSPIKLGNAILCGRCAATIERCHSCGEPLLKDYSFFEGNEALKYCLECTRKYPRCDDCGAPSGPYGTALDDGRYLCPECRKVALFEPGLVASIKARVEGFLEGSMGMKITHEISFSLKDKNFLKTKAKNIHGDLNGLFYRKGEAYFIYVLYGLREKDLISVLAHEMAHAWQSEKCSEKLALEDTEGFAQWVAFKALYSYDNGDFAQLMLKADNIYSKGLVKMLAIEKTSGPKGVFDYITSGEP
jgi:recombinational DNA repair protein (RecF pathway)